MITTSRLALQQPETTDPVSALRTATAANAAILARAAVADQGTLASRPTSTPESPGLFARLYRVASGPRAGQVDFDHGSGWLEDVFSTVPVGSVLAYANTPSQVQCPTNARVELNALSFTPGRASVRGILTLLTVDLRGGAGYGYTGMEVRHVVNNVETTVAGPVELGFEQGATNIGQPVFSHHEEQFANLIPGDLYRMRFSMRVGANDPQLAITMETRGPGQAKVVQA